MGKIGTTEFIRAITRHNLLLGHFLTPKAGPCILLNPRLIKLATEYSDKCLLVLAQFIARDAALDDPTNPRIPADLAKRLMSEGEYL